MLNNFDYFKPDDINQALKLLADKKNTAILAGGTDLVVNMKEDVERPDNIIDIKNIEELSKVQFYDEGLFIGATVTCNQLKNNEQVASKYPLLVKAASVMGSHQIRNRATIVGNICNSSPGADTPPALLTLGTRVLIISSEGEKKVSLEEFFTGVKENVLKDNEIVKGIIINPVNEKARGDYRRKTRVEGSDLCSCGVAGYVSKEDKIVKFGYGALAPIPILIDASDIFFKTDNSLDECINQLIERVNENIKPITDVRSNKNYRENLSRVYTRRIITELWEEGE